MQPLRRVFSIIAILVIVIAPFICPQFCRLKELANQTVTDTHGHSTVVIDAADHDHSQHQPPPPQHHRHDHNGSVTEMLRLLNAVMVFVIVAVIVIRPTLLTDAQYIARLLLVNFNSPILTPPPRLHVA
ncbi:MAG: hypothetical protein KIH69_023960 [Anaerolineae bacterium]|nr:hypothetical protein [Anaerolineae bacterium]